MTTDPKTSNAFRAPSHPELDSTDTNPRRLYEVTVHRTEYLYATVRVEAASEDEAKIAGDARIAELKQSEWNIADAGQYVYSVEQVTKGGRNV